LHRSVLSPVKNPQLNGIGNSFHPMATILFFRTSLLRLTTASNYFTDPYWLYRNSSRNSYRYGGVNTILWIEKLLQTPIVDCRKYAIWRFLMPYLFNVKKLSESEVIDLTQTWLNKCDHMRSLDFNVKYLIRQNIRNSKKNQYLPVSFDKLAAENKESHYIISRW
jgi:hypothetical protein